LRNHASNFGALEYCFEAFEAMEEKGARCKDVRGEDPQDD
jgi:hypothetical protein